jgi:hypothetical protein
MPNFDDVYLHNYEVLGYGLICKIIKKWGLVSVASGPDANLICLDGYFSCHSDVEKYGSSR